MPSENGIPRLSFSAELPTSRIDAPEEFLTQEAVAELARGAEQAGFSACHVTDHPAPDARWLDGGGHHAMDPFVALSFAAAATSTLRLLTYMFIAPYRNPFLGAKAAMSLDVLSGGRLILGAAAGYLRPEFGALGVDFDERNELLEEALVVMRAAWTGDVVAFSGRHFRARGVRMQPSPTSQPHPPIWMGGNSTYAMHRAVETCEGWAPFATVDNASATRTAAINNVDDLAVRLADARRYASDIGRKEPLDVCFSGGSIVEESVPLAQRRGQLQRMADIGVTWVTVGFEGDDRRTVTDRIRRFGEVFGAADRTAG